MQITFRPLCKVLEFGNVVRKLKTAKTVKILLATLISMNILYTNSTLFFNVLFSNFLEEKHGESKVKGRKGEGPKYKKRNCQALTYIL